MQASRWTAGLALLLACGLIAAGCGSSSKSSSTAPSQTPTTKDQAIQLCTENAKKISDAGARRTAEAACQAAATGNTSAVKAAAHQQCLSATRAIPDAGARAAAQQRCKTATR